MNIGFNKAVSEIRSIKLEAAEKDHILAAILSSPATAAHKVRVASPYGFNAWAWAHRTSIAAVAAFIIVAGGGTSVAAMGSVPGERFYGMKTSFLEPTRLALTLTDVAKARYEAGLAERRMDEGQVLAERGTLDAAAQSELSGRIVAHTESLDATLSEVAAKDPERASMIVADFTQSMDERADKLSAAASSRGLATARTANAPAPMMAMSLKAEVASAPADPLAEAMERLAESARASAATVRR